MVEVSSRSCSILVNCLFVFAEFLQTNFQSRKAEESTNFSHPLFVMKAGRRKPPFEVLRVFLHLYSSHVFFKEIVQRFDRIRTREKFPEIPSDRQPVDREQIVFRFNVTVE